MQFFADGICAGAYRGGRADLSKMLVHAISDTPFTIGRISRAAGQALCNPQLDVCGSWDPITGVTCAKCQAMLLRLLPACPR